VIDMYHRPNEPRSIQKMCNEEDRIARAKAVLVKDAKVAHRTDWESKTEGVVDRVFIKNLARDFQMQDQQKLMERRQRLAALLAEEDEQYKHEIDLQRETSSDRAKKNVLVARQAKQEREMKRQAFADEQIRRVWRDGCDDLRNIRSVKVKEDIHSHLEKQIKFKSNLTNQQLIEEEKHTKEWEQMKKKMDERADEEENARKKENEAIKQALIDQMKDAESRRREEKRIKADEQNAFQEKLNRDAENAQKRQREMWEEKKKVKMELAKFNKESEEKKKQTQEQERLRERAEIEIILNQHRADTHQMLIDKRQMRMERFEYMEFLRQRKEEEKKIEDEMERLTHESLNRDNQKQDIRYKKEMAAREELMRQVNEQRIEQMKQKREREEREAREMEREKELIENQLKMWKLRSQEEMNEERQKALIRKAELEKQIEANRIRRDILHANQEQEHLDSKRAEEAYQKFLEEEKRSLKYDERKKK